jgi:DNA polymerase-1
LPDRLVLIDGNSLVHRAYHAIPNLTTSSGRPVGAVYGFAQTVLKLLEESPPDYAAVAFDPPGKTFRHEVFTAYKANRPPTPPDLIEQFGLVRRMAEVCRLRSVETPGFEADDVIGTLAEKGAAAGMDVVIVSLDRDCLQLVNDRVTVLSPSRGPLDAVLFDAQAVKETYGYEPTQVTDAKSLIGDPSDNIPGVPKIGKKTATTLLEKHGSVEEILKHPEDVPNKIAREYVQAHPQAVLVAKRLATIRTDTPLDATLEELKWPGPDADELRALLTELEFRTLLERLPAPDAEEPTQGFALLDSPAEVATWCERLGAAGEIGVCVLAERGAFQGLALAQADGRACFVPAALFVEPDTATPGLFDSAEPPPDTSAIAECRESLRRVLENRGITKHGGGLKDQAAALYKVGLDLVGFGFDPALASYVLEPQRRDHSVAATASERLGRPLLPLVRDREPQPSAACAWAAAALELRQPLRDALEQAGLLGLFDEMETPLAPILLKMERAGVAVDVNKLRDLSTQMERKLADLSAEIHELAGGPFNVDSPKQLGEVLFSRLGLPVQKRTKTGPSTDAEVLEKLEEQHPIVPLIGEYRSFAKLKSTYVDALADLAQQCDGRVRTTFEQTVAATGRLSSRDPNLQNIPIRTDWGAKIRSCFVAGSPELRLLSADYSQIELRLLAHFSQDANLLAAFRAGEDIHTRTAAEVFGVPPDQVTSEMRRQAKTVNFAVLYGMGPASLARSIGVSREEATQFIANYFAKLPGVERYLTQTLEQARERGYTSTLMGRRRAFPELHSTSDRDRAYAERAAVNSPLQGSAADIIKVAMVRLDPLLAERGPAVRLLLQVHDELLLELPRDELDDVGRLVKEVMERACELDVPLAVDVSVGENWRDLQPLWPATG